MSFPNIRARATVAAPLFFLVLVACPGEKEPEGAPPERIIQVGVENIALVRSGQLESGPLLSGALAPERQATVRAEVGGPVIETTAETGQPVVIGTLLVRINGVEIESAWLSARSMLSAAENGLAVAAREEQRAVALAAAGAISERDLDMAKRAHIAAQAQLADAKARMALADKQRSATRVTAAFAGVVSEKLVSVGDFVQPGSPLYTLIDPASMRLEASLPAAQLSEVRVGTLVRFTVSGYRERPFTGRISSISPTSDAATGQIRILVSIPNAGNSLVSGLFAEGRVASATRTALVAPVAAVNSTGLTPFVMRVKSGRVEKVEVTVGAQDAGTESLEILTGLVVGDTLLLGPAQGLAPGTPVRTTSGPESGSAPPSAAPPPPPPQEGAGS